MTQQITQKNTAVFGLSGNPPTKNHALFIQHLLSLPQYDLVRVVLNQHSPLKPSHEYLEAEARFELLQAMLVAEHVDMSRCVLERVEIDKAPPSYMFDTLNFIKARERARGIDEHMTLILGADALNQFTKWYKWHEFSALCKLVFYPRKGEQVLSDALNTLKAVGLDVTLVDINKEPVPMSEGAATHARAHYLSGKKGIPQGITKAVDKLIRARGYYGAAS